MAADILVGDSQDTIYLVDDPGDVVRDPGGNDTIQTTLNEYTLSGTVYDPNYMTWDNKIEKLEFIGIGDFKGSGSMAIGNAETIIGGGGNDTLDGGLGADSLVGGGGNDRLIANGPTSPTSDDGSVDTLVGGAGNDTYVVGSRDIVQEDADSGFDTVDLTAMSTYSLVPFGPIYYDTSYTLGNNIENLTFSGYANGPGGVTLIGNDLDNVIRNVSPNGPITLDGGAGADTLIGGNGADTYIVDDEGDIVTETSDYFGPDTVLTSLNHYALTDNVENLTFTGTGDFHGIGNELSNTIIGGDGNDTLEGGSSGYEDRLIGGRGNDLYRVNADSWGDEFGNAVVESFNEGIDTIEYVGEGYGSEKYIAEHVENARFVGTGYLNIIGNGLDNDIAGGSGGDTLNGGDGADTLTGGDGDDTYFIDSSLDVIVENADGGSDTVVSDLQYYKLADNLENLTLGFDEISERNGDGNALSNVIQGKGGDNIIKGMDGDDTIYGGGGKDWIDGGAGNDDLTATYGDASVFGGDGSDNIYVDFGAFLVNGEAGDDNIRVGYGAGSSTLSGGGGNDTIYSGDGADSILGEDGNDAIYAANSADTVYGGLGNDTIDGGLGNDDLDGGEGYDFLNLNGARTDYTFTKNPDGSIAIKDLWTFDGNEGTDTFKNFEAIHFRDGLLSLDDLLKMPEGRITLPAGPTGPQGPQGPQGPTGPQGPQGPTVTVPLVPQVQGDTTPANDRIVGTDGNDTIRGMGGNDALIGGIGDDWLYGGTGKDILTGGAGKDVFFFDTKPNKSSNVDKITDFNVKDDSIYLENAIFKTIGKGSAAKPGALKSSYFYVGTKAHDTDDRLIYNKKSGALYYDADGSGSQAQVQIATLSKNLKLTYKDFFVI